MTLVQRSDSGRLQNELQTLFPAALEYQGGVRRIHLNRIPTAVPPIYGRFESDVEPQPP